MSASNTKRPTPHEVVSMQGLPSQKSDESLIFSPKLNGFRGVWDLVRGELFSRSRRAIRAPEMFVAQMPRLAPTSKSDQGDGFYLDGELVYDPRALAPAELLASQPSDIAAQSNFERLSSIVRGGGSDWTGVRFVCFDVFYHGDADSPKNRLLLRDRLVMLHRIAASHQKLLDAKSNSSPAMNVFIIMQYFRYDPAHHAQYMEYAKQKGHEGIVIRDTATVYRDASASMVKDRVYKEAQARLEEIVHNRGGVYLHARDGSGRLVKIRVANPADTQLPVRGESVPFRFYTMTQRGAYMNATFLGASSKI
jgi:ATP-dependent DNA ligase